MITRTATLSGLSKSRFGRIKLPEIGLTLTKFPPRKPSNCRRRIAILLCALLGITDLPANAQEPQTKEQILEVLRGSVKNRVDIEELQSRVKNSLTVAPRAPAAQFEDIKRLPGLDFEIYFAYDSAAPLPDSYRTLVSLGQALSDQSLADSKFLIAGHTDARGSAEYNIKLSEKRSQAVKDFLEKNFRLAPERLVAIGFGKQDPKLPQNPEAAANRRVRVMKLN